MSDDTKQARRRKLQAQSREFPETMELLGKVRDALAAQLFLTPISAKEVREDIYTRVQALDALKPQMAAIMAEANSEKAIAEYAQKIATTGK